jgi:diketogulonate reductase-like aldo/keto reductase
LLSRREFNERCVARLLRDPTLARIGAGRGCSAAAVALAWTIRSGNVITIPESGSVAHVKENAVALSLTLTLQKLKKRTACRSRISSLRLEAMGPQTLRVSLPYGIDLSAWV